MLRQQEIPASSLLSSGFLARAFPFADAFEMYGVEVETAAISLYPEHILALYQRHLS